jgi:hypothetical protein
VGFARAGTADQHYILRCIGKFQSGALAYERLVHLRGSKVEAGQVAV